MKTKLTFLTLLMVSFICKAQSIEKFSVDSGGASTTVGNINILYTIGEVNVQELSTPSVSMSEGFINANFKIKIDPKLFLQGPMLNPVIAGQMNDNLRSGGLIPTTSPYPDGATCNASVFSVTGNNAIVDWVWVELRAANDNTKRINGKSALVQRDGDVVGLDGVSNLVMSAAPTNYYVVVDHRNHNGAMTSGVIGLNETTPTVVDFTSNSLATYGVNARALLVSGNMALWAGDANGNGTIRFLGPGNDSGFIKAFILGISSSNFFPYTGYHNADINMNGQVRYLGPGNDTGLLKTIVLAHPSNGASSNFYPIQTQIPN